MKSVPQNFVEHDCINLRLPTSGGLYVWEIEKHGHTLDVRVEGQLTFDATPQIVTAAVQGFGVAYVLEEAVARHIAEDRLNRVLADSCPPFSRYHLSYTRRQSSPTLAVLVDALRHRA